jgi:outer membrane protein insertion porin family
MEAYQVKSIVLNGNFHFSSRTLLQQMTLAPKKGLKYLLKKAPLIYFDEKLLQADLNHMTRFYQQEGYLNVHIALADEKTNPKRRTVSLSIDIQEGLPVLVSQVLYTFSSNQDSAAPPSVSSLKLKAGHRFRDEALKLDIERLNLYFMDNGFPYAKIDYHLDVNKEENSVAVTYEIDPGPASTFGPVAIEGRGLSSERTIRRQFSFQPGDVFQKKALDKTQRQLYNLSIFEIATATARLPKPPQPAVPVQVMVKEAPRFTTKFGVGYGKEEQFRTFVNFQWLQFFGGARRFNIQVKHSYLEPYYMDSRLMQPAFFSPGATLGVNPFIRRQVEPGFRLSRNGANLFVQKTIGSVLIAGITYTFEQVDIELNSIAAPTLSKELKGLYNKSSLLLGLSVNTTDNPFAPTGGFRNSMTVKYSGIGPSDYHYTKWLIDLRYYRSLLGFVAATRVSMGKLSSLDPSGVIPVEDLFFAGGANSVRGWGRQELGPKDSEDKPIGGNSIVEASLEGRIPIWDSLQGALFSDAGNVWLDQPILSFDQIRYSVGVGLRFQTPIGPIRFDVARPVFDVQHGYYWHLTVGEAF